MAATVRSVHMPRRDRIALISVLASLLKNSISRPHCRALPALPRSDCDNSQQRGRFRTFSTAPAHKLFKEELCCRRMVHPGGQAATDVAVLGAGPGGYVAALRLAHQIGRASCRERV